MIISWPLHLKRCLRLSPRGEAHFKHFLPTLTEERPIWKPPCAANLGLFGLGDENRQAVIKCVWWWVCERLYWKVGSVIFFYTTLVIASSFVGLAGTKVNKTKQVVKEKSSKEPQVQWERWWDDQGSTERQQREEIVAAGLFRGCWDTDPPATFRQTAGEHLEKLQQQLLYPAL